MLFPQYKFPKNYKKSFHWGSIPVMDSGFPLGGRLPLAAALLYVQTKESGPSVQHPNTRHYKHQQTVSLWTSRLLFEIFGE